MEVTPHIQLNRSTTLQRFEPHHAPQLRAAATSSLPQLLQWLQWDIDHTPTYWNNWVQRSITRWDTQQAWNYGLWHTHHRRPQLCGVVSINRSADPEERELGYWLRTTATKRGLMTAAVTALTHETLTMPGVHRVRISCDAMNHRSARVAQRCGYTLERVEPCEKLAPAETGWEMVWMHYQKN